MTLMTEETNLSEWKKPASELGSKTEGFGVAEKREEEKPQEKAPDAAAAKQAEITPGAKPSPAKLARQQVKIPQVRDEVTVKIEKILEMGIGDAYGRLSPVAKQEFKIKGEQTALAIRELLKSTHVKVKNIFRLILEWLKMLPGINHFFLEQEAKIKADRIIALSEQTKN